MKNSKQLRSEQTYMKFMNKLHEYVVQGEVDKFTIRGLCSSLGFSPRTFYLYFENKEQAILKCFEYYSVMVCEKLSDKKRDFQNSLEWLMYLLEQHQQIALDDPEMGKQVYISTLKYYDVFSISNEYPLFQLIRDALSDCERDGKFRLKKSAEDAAWALISYSRGIQVEYFRRNASFDLLESSRNLLKDYLTLLVEMKK